MFSLFFLKELNSRLDHIFELRSEIVHVVFNVQVRLTLSFTLFVLKRIKFSVCIIIVLERIKYIISEKFSFYNNYRTKYNYSLQELYDILYQSFNSLTFSYTYQINDSEHCSFASLLYFPLQRLREASIYQVRSSEVLPWLWAFTLLTYSYIQSISFVFLLRICKFSTSGFNNNSVRNTNKKDHQLIEQFFILKNNSHYVLNVNKLLIVLNIASVTSRWCNSVSYHINYHFPQKKIAILTLIH